MTIRNFEPHTVRLCQYVIASADMYYTELEQRDVFLKHDGRGNIHIWGEIVGRGPSTKVDLCEIFLEYGLYCCSWCSMAEALYHMQDFGKQLGCSLAKYLTENSHLLTSPDPTVRALEHIFETMGACFSTEHSGSGTQLVVTDCPLEKTAERSGLRTIELAHHGINAMCRSLIRAMNPNLDLAISAPDSPEFIFTIVMPVPA